VEESKDVCNHTMMANNQKVVNSGNWMILLLLEFCRIKCIQEIVINHVDYRSKWKDTNCDQKKKECQQGQ
jgi:hypothetical protein